MTHQKVILITGTSSGFGAIAAKQLALKGHVVYASMRDTEGRNKAAADELSASSENINVVELELSSTEQVSAAVDSVIDQQGRIDVVVNNAGLMNVGLTEAYDESQHYAQMEANYFGPVRLFRAALPYMRAARSGLFVTVTSIAGRLVFPAFTTYNSSKFAAEALAEGYRYELGPLGIDSVIIEPGPFVTNLVSNSPKPADQDRVEAYGELGVRMSNVLGGFEAFFEENAEEVANPQIVVNDMIALIEAKHGDRPLRTVCGDVDYGARQLNTVCAPIQSGVLEAMEMKDLDV